MSLSIGDVAHIERCVRDEREHAAARAERRRASVEKIASRILGKRCKLTLGSDRAELLSSRGSLLRVDGPDPIWSLLEWLAEQQ